MVLLSISLSLHSCSFVVRVWKLMYMYSLLHGKKCPAIRDEKNASLVELKIYKFGENLWYMYM